MDLTEISVFSCFLRMAWEVSSYQADTFLSTGLQEEAVLWVLTWETASRPLVDFTEMPSAHRGLVLQTHILAGRLLDVPWHRTKAKTL